MICPKCGKEMKQLFTSMYCDCEDRAIPVRVTEPKRSNNPKDYVGIHPIDPLDAVEFTYVRPSDNKAISYFNRQLFRTRNDWELYQQRLQGLWKVQWPYKSIEDLDEC